MQQDKVRAFLEATARLYTVVDVNPQLLNNDRLHYQRARDEKKVEHYLKHLDDGHDQPIALLVRRADGSLWVIDRQHHSEAAVRRGVPLIPSVILESQGIDWETSLFHEYAGFQAQHNAV